MTKFETHRAALCLSVNCGVLLLTLPIGIVQAQQAEARSLLEEVTVTARRREESNQRVPVAITSVSGDALQNASVQRVEELRFVAPSLQISPTPFGNAVPGYTIRGQRQLESLATQDPSVVVYFADVPMMRPHATNGAFFDIDSVQVLKGPQGTLFGRNTTGGAVLINPKRPTHDFGGEIAVGFGNHGEVNGTGVLNVPAGDTLAIRAAGTIRQSDGYTRNLVNGKMLDEDDNWADASRRAMVTYASRWMFTRSFRRSASTLRHLAGGCSRSIPQAHTAHSPASRPNCSRHWPR